MTRQRKARFQPMHSPLCPPCASAPGSSYHLIWSCPEIQSFWLQGIHFLLDKMGSPVVPTPKLCLAKLGLLPDLEIDKFLATFTYEMLFLARKTVARNWMQALPLTIQRWKMEINNNLPF